MIRLCNERDTADGDNCIRRVMVGDSWRHNLTLVGPPLKLLFIFPVNIFGRQVEKDEYSSSSRR